MDTLGVRRFNAAGKRVTSFPDAATEAMAVLEAQFMSMRSHGQKLGLHPRKIIATGGASSNATITRVLANVFGCPVQVAAQPDSASLGAAYRAMHGFKCLAHGEFVPFAEALGMDPAEQHRVVALPDPAAFKVYTNLLPR